MRIYKLCFAACLHVNTWKDFRVNLHLQTVYVMYTYIFKRNLMHILLLYKLKISQMLRAKRLCTYILKSKCRMALYCKGWQEGQYSTITVNTVKRVIGSNPPAGWIPSLCIVCMLTLWLFFLAATASSHSPQQDQINARISN